MKKNTVKSQKQFEIQLNFCTAIELSTNVNGIGSMLSHRIVDERNKNGDFKDWTDVQKRVHGVGLKTIEKIRNEGFKIDKFHASNRNDDDNVHLPVKSKGFEIHYVNLGPQTIFSNEKNWECRNLCFHMPTKQKKRTFEES